MYATQIAVAAAVLWGAVTGLLLPRAAYRLSVEPDEPWRDACPAGHPFTGPARGWLGAPRCPRCAAPLAAPAPRPRTPTATAPATATAAPVPPVPPEPVRSAAPPLAPVLTALVCGALAAATGPRPELAVWLAAAPVAVLLALVDHAVHRLPDRLTLPLAAGTALLLGAAAALPGSAGSWPSALLGGLALGAGYAVLFLVNPNGMGFGDVKLALALGVALGWYGWAVLFAGAFAGFLAGALYGFGLVVLRRAGRKSVIPFGPFMLIGALLGVLLGAAGA
ncbi:prepilin peptidase [Streptomyces sp. NPDC015131]|uniref:prepilin peptidase n=1 Tax=Streptomyces sp. NPDC015131 TaxID=3364941 RepID=UPI0036FB5B97